jgi:hypothetical protein
LETHGSENANPKMGCLSENSKSWWKKERTQKGCCDACVQIFGVKFLRPIMYGS